MKKKLILHIGQSKTGTSAIQDHLARNRSSLLKEGYLYPRIIRGNVPLDIANHNGFADSLVRPTVFPRLAAEEYVSQILEQSADSKVHTVILSAEHFLGGQPRVWDVSSSAEFDFLYAKKLQNLANFTEKFETTIVCYLRPQASWLSSGINQTIKIARLISPDVNICESDKKFFDMAKMTLRYSERLRAWESTTKPKSMIVVPYVRSALAGGDSVTDFMQRVGMEELKLASSVKSEVNQSLSIDNIEIKKILNENAKSKHKERAIIKALGELSAQSSLGKTYMVDPEVISELVEYVRDDNIALSKNFMRDGESIDALTGYDAAKLRRPTAQEVNDAMERYLRTMRTPRMTLYMNISVVKSIIRRHTPTIHAVLNQAKVKMMSFRTKIGN